MPKGPSLRLGLSQFTRCPSTSTRRFFRTSLPSPTTVTLPLYDILAASGPTNNTASRSDPRELLKNRLFEQLEVLLTLRNPPHARVWSQYFELLHFVGAKDIPLETHQRVLRHCVPPAVQLRATVGQPLGARRDPRNPHRHENRLQTVIRNIKATGSQPALEDYHVILGQFAAAGHHMGAAHVYEELVASDIQPQPKTYGLLLQSLAHRLTLPCSVSSRRHLVHQVTRICRDILTEMWSRGILFSSANLDLTMRILKETSDEEGFAHLMRVGYGVDLDYPDRAPVEALMVQENIAADELGKDLPSPAPLSTAALNTTIDTLGRFGNVSKLVQAFEVLTQPLPPEADQHFSRSFDDEDDDYGVSSPTSTQLYRAPHAAPNTTTYNLLLKHISRSGHGPLARHYLQQAFYFDRMSDRTNRSEMINLPEEVPAPHFAINRGTILPVFGLANRDKDMELMRWVGYVIRQTVRRKKNDVIYYSAIAAKLAKESLSLQSSADHAPSTPVSPSPNVAPAARTAALRSHNPSELSAAVFEVDLDAPLVTAPPPTKKFNINLHLQILHRDLDELAALYRQVSNITFRTTQRVKERLGRRVWAGKDVYLLSENKRRLVSRRTWSNIVHFKRPEDRNLGIRFRMPGRQDPPHGKPNFAPGRRRISTSAFVERVNRRRRSV